MTAKKTQGKKVLPEKLTVSDEMIAEASDKIARLPIPAGAPLLRNYHQLDRRTRANFLLQLDNLAPTLNAFNDELEARAASGQANDEDNSRAATGLAVMVADLEDLLALIAVHPAAFTEWALAAPDEAILAMFQRYTSDMRQGEANSSLT